MEQLYPLLALTETSFGSNFLPATYKGLTPDKYQKTNGCFPLGFMWIIIEPQFEIKENFTYIIVICVDFFYLSRICKT